MVKKISSQPSVSLGCDLGLTCHDSKVSTCCCRPALPSVIELQRWTRKWLMRLNASPLWQIHLLPILGMREWTMEIQMIVILGRSVRWWVTHAKRNLCFLIFSQLVSRNASTFQPMRCLTCPFVRATRKQFVGPRCHGRHGIRLTTARPGATWKVEIFLCRNVVFFFLVSLVG